MSDRRERAFAVLDGVSQGVPMSVYKYGGKVVILDDVWVALRSVLEWHIDNGKGFCRTCRTIAPCETENAVLDVLVPED